MLRVTLVMTILIGCGRLGFDDVAADAPPALRTCVRALAAHGDQACIVRTDGAVHCWGEGSKGGLGDGTLVDRYVPGPALISDVVALGSGELTMCAIKADGSVWCWGSNLDGQVGDGTTTDRSTPTLVDLHGPAVEVASSQYHSCVRLVDGGGLCWGRNSEGALGIWDSIQMIVPVPTTSAVGGNLGMALGDHVTCAIRPDRSLACWGRNLDGELGDGTTQMRRYPARVQAIVEPVVQVSAGCHHHVCAATATGDAWCWGANDAGQTGRGSITARESVPVRVAGVSGVVQVGVGATHSCARTADHQVWCWGQNARGQLGDGTFEDRLTPVRVLGLAGPLVDLQLTCTSTHVVLADGTVLSWGSSVLLGTGEIADRATPAETVVACP